MAIASRRTARETQVMRLLKTLTEAHGPSGDEARVRKIIQEELKGYVDEMRVDRLGNLIARKKGKGNRVMVAAHMDEIGLMVKKIDSEGHIKFSTVGGIEPVTLIGQSVRIYRKRGTLACFGIITFAELHEDHEIDEMPDLEDLYIDTGLSKVALERKGIDIGCYVIARHHFKTLGNDNIISGKALDDRLGCFALIEVARRLNKAPRDIFFVFTVQEEIGLYGAQISTYELDPDWGLAVDTINAEDSDEFTTKGVEMGKGPTILVKDADIITNKETNDWIAAVAKIKKIPLQLRVEEEGTTDATKMFLSREAIPATTITIPVRNLHSTVGIAHMKDVNNMIELVLALLKRPARDLPPPMKRFR